MTSESLWGMNALKHMARDFIKGNNGRATELIKAFLEVGLMRHRAINFCNMF